MRNNQNKHGPDVDIGVWYAALLRHSEAASGDSGKGSIVRAGPVEGEATLNAKCTESSVYSENGTLMVSTGFDCTQPPPLNHRANVEPWNSRMPKRRRRQTIVNRRTGESPPGIVNDLRLNNIDSLSQRKGTYRGCNFTGKQTAVLSVMEGLWPLGKKLRITNDE